jgi:hypothetical protein
MGDSRGSPSGGVIQGVTVRYLSVMMDAMTADGPAPKVPASLVAWATGARGNDGFVGAGAVLLIVASLFFVLGVHGSSYSQGSVPDSIAFLGALAAQATVIALAVTVAVLYPSAWRRTWWRVLAGVTLVLLLFFAGLPAVVAGYSWLAVLLLVVATVVYDVIVTTWLVVVRPWSALTASR